MGLLVYRARPIDRDRGAWMLGAPALVEKALSALPGVMVYRPEGAWSVGGGPVDPRLEALNRQALGSADAVVAYLPQDVSTLGVGREIEAARSLGIPVCILAGGGGSLWSGADCHVLPMEVSSVGPLLAWLAAVPSGPREGISEALGAADGPKGPLGVVRVSEAASLPFRAHPGDAGFDLAASQDVEVPPGGFADVPTGLRLVFPEGIWGRVTGRSSTLRRRGLLVAEGILDQGYRGEVFVGLWNLSPDPVLVRAGERPAQLVLHSVVADRVGLQEVGPESVPGSSRGTSGFGSSGL
jgi:dUTP pyrophosphatase